MKIGILGGTFNPVHIGHLILAEEAREKLGLDKVIFVPSFLPPHKDNSDIAKAADRLSMIKLAIKTNKYFLVSDTEIKRNGRSYTIDTIKEFKDEGVLTGFYVIFPGKTLSCFFTFVKGSSWLVERLDVSANHSAPVSEEFALKLARTIAHKIPAGEPGQKEAKKK